MSVCIVLHEEVVVIRKQKILESACKIPALEPRVKDQTILYLSCLDLVGFQDGVVSHTVTT